jgi:hypothetical protein
MKYIKKYIKFFETAAEPTIAKSVLSSNHLTIMHDGEERTESDVVYRLSRIYKTLSTEEKRKINSYFE